MDDEEDWDEPTEASPKPSAALVSQSAATPQQTLKITDGYKYSYEALASPANIDDWIEPASYGGRTSNGYSQSSFRDNKRSFGDKNDINRRFNSLKQNETITNNSPRTNFGTPNANQFTNKSTTEVEDWDAPDTSTNQLNGSWNENVTTPAHIATPAAADEDDWDEPEEAAEKHNTSSKSVEIPIYNPNALRQDNSQQDNSNQNISVSKADDEENWDDPSEESKDEKPSEPKTIAPLEPMKSSSFEPRKFSNNTDNDEENWDDEPNETSAKTTAPAIEIPIYKPDKVISSARISEHGNSPPRNTENWDMDTSEPISAPNPPGGNPFGDVPMFKPHNPINQRYENNFHSNKFSRGGYESNDRFGRDSYNRHSRGHRHSPYERGGRGRGRGGRGGRGGRDRDGRDGRDDYYNKPYNNRDNRDNRDNSRFRDDRGDRPYHQNSFHNKNRNDRPPFQPPPPNSFNNKGAEPQEDWDTPSGYAQKSSEFKAPPIAAPPPPAQHVEEESWD